MWYQLGTFNVLTCPRAFAEPRRSQIPRLFVTAGVVGRVGLSSPGSHEAKQRIVYKNHPTHDCEIDPTNDRLPGHGTGHPWGRLGNLCWITEVQSYRSVVSIDKSFAEA
jgi:hypothetical protein